MPTRGVPSASPGPLDDLNNETPALRSEPTWGSDPTVSNIPIVLYSFFGIFRRLSGGTPLSPPHSPCDRFPYGLTSPADARARGIRRMLAPSPLTSEFMGMVSYAPTTFHELPNDEGESDGSSIDDMAPSHRSSRECAMADAPRQLSVVAESV